MKKSEVTIGNVYTAKVSGKVVRVRLDGENRHGGWDATNLETKKKVRIRSAARLRAEVAAKRGRPAKVAPEDAPVEAVTDSPATNAKRSAKVKRVKQPTKAASAKPKRVSALDAAAQVLKASGQAMRSGEMIAAMAEQGLWSSPNGKTPEATLYAAILREINAKGKDARFRKTERGKFEYAG
ncbi:MAG: winged helix-turn-helix domain-containing protein [Phycisphaerae bacterium]